MTAPPPAGRLAKRAAEAVEKLLEIGAPMDPVVVDEVERYREAANTPTADADLMDTSVALLTAMSASLPEYGAAVAALVPALATRAEVLRRQANPNIAAALEMFPQHTR